MARWLKGQVVGKDFRPPPGARHEDWCYLVVDISDGDLVSIRLDREKVDRAILGDSVEFRRPRRRNKPVRWIRRI